MPLSDKELDQLAAEMVPILGPSVSLNSTKELLQQLTKLMTEDPVKILLLVQTKNTTTFLIVLGLLIGLVEKDLPKVLQVLQLKNKDNEHLGHFLLNNPEVGGVYVSLLTHLADKNPSEVLTVLQQQDTSLRSVGHVITGSQTSIVIRAYFALLTKLMAHDPSSVLTILQQQGKDQGNIGCILITNAEMANVYFALLTRFIDQDPSGVLTALHYVGVSMGIVSVDEVYMAYFSLLTKLIGQDPSGVLNLLQQQGEHQWHVGHQIAYYLSLEIIQVYFDLLAILVEQCPQYLPEIIGYLQQKDTDGCNMLSELIARKGGEITIYFDFLEKLAEKYPVEITSYLQLPQEQDGWDVEYKIAYSGKIPAMLACLKFSEIIDVNSEKSLESLPPAASNNDSISSTGSPISSITPQIKTINEYDGEKLSA